MVDIRQAAPPVHECQWTRKECVAQLVAWVSFRPALHVLDHISLEVMWK
jgi:hypothetical protein